MNRRFTRLLAAGVATSALAAGAVAGEAAGPPPPTAASGAAVEQLAGANGNTVTAFAFGAGHVFAAEVPSGPGSPGGVYVIAGGTATRLTNGPAVAFGVAWHQNALYVSTNSQLLRMSGWDGTTFRTVKVLYTGPKHFTGFNGIGFGADGRLYAGVALSETGDHGPPKTPYAYDLLSFSAAGKGLKVVATGIRQPWQMAFPAHSSSPYLSDLGQDAPNGIKAPDFLLRINPVQAYGFPSCNWVKARDCRGYAKPVRFFSPHTSPMGIAIGGKSLYLVTGFGNPSTHTVISLPMKGHGSSKPVLTGVAAPFVGLGISRGYLYVGDAAGDVYRTKL